MDPLGETAATILQRCPAPALTLDALYDTLRTEARELVPPKSRILGALENQPGLRILRRPPCLGESPIGPVAWVVATGSDRRPEHRVRSVPERLRQTLVALAELVEPESLREWARWNRMLLEEGRIRDALSRSQRARPPEPPKRVPPPSTTNPAPRRRRRKAAISR